MSVKELIDNNYIIIPDTNVLLNIYRYSPEFADFALDCWLNVKDSVVLTATVDMEYRRHARSRFGGMKRRLKEARQKAINQFSNNGNKIINSFNELKKYQYPDIEVLQQELAGKLEEVKELINVFFEARPGLSLAANEWGDTDRVGEFESSLSVMSPFSQKELYDICDDGADRYRREIPPGYKDAKDKDGIRQYSDLIIWKEILRYARDNSKNIILVTDDVKPDWWEGSLFHSKLIEEFEKETGKKIVAFVSTAFYADVAVCYQVDKPDIIDIALNMTDSDYALNVCDCVFDRIIGNLLITADEYIGPENNIGSEGLGELELVDSEFVEAERIERDDYGITYLFTYQIIVEGYSTDYWGKDDETKEIIESPEMYHKFSGEIGVEVKRTADIFVNFEEDDDFESAELISGELEEIEFEPWYGDEEEADQEVGFGRCGYCGRALTFCNRADSGFCIECAEKYDL